MKLVVPMALALASCATTPPLQPAEELHRLEAIVGGSETSLKRFEAAARACGANVFSIDRGSETRWIGIGLGTGGEPAGADPRIRCALQWVMENPGEELGFVGNERRP